MIDLANLPKVGSTHILTNHLISDFNPNDEVRILGYVTFNKSNQKFITLEDTNFVPSKERPLKRCTVYLDEFEQAILNSN